MPDDDAAKVRWPPPVLPLEQIDVAAVNALTSTLKGVDCHGVYNALEKALSEALKNGRSEDAAMFQVLGGLSTIVLCPSDEGATWGAMLTTGTSRSPLPEDVAGEQSRILAELAPAIEHPGLRARLADVAWTNDRTLGRAAALAIESYCECAERLVDGRSMSLTGREGPAPYDALTYVERALGLGAVTRRGRIQSERTVAALRSVYALAFDQKDQVGTFVRAANLGLKYSLLDVAQVASDAEAAGNNAKPGGYPLAARAAFDLAAQLYEQSGDAEAKRRCQLAAVDRILEMRAQVSSPGAEAHWVQTALFALRHVRGTEGQRRELRRELRDLQEDVLGEMGHFFYPLDVTEKREFIEQRFDDMDLPEALKNFALLSRSKPVAELREAALKSREDHPMAGMMSKGFLDADGKTAARAPGASGKGEPDEDWFKATINEHEGIRRHVMIEGWFEPARTSIMRRHAVSERHLVPIVAQSPFVRADQAGIMSLGFTRLLQGDFRSAVHLLVPQLEASLRYILRLAGHDPVVEFDDMTEENVGLSALMDPKRLRPELERYLPEEVLLEIDLLFHHHAGSSLRHALAHGFLTTGACFSIDAVYACWVIYHLTCVPLLADWERVVAPGIKAACS